MEIIEVNIPTVESVIDDINRYSNGVDGWERVSVSGSGSADVDSAVEVFGALLDDSGMRWASDTRGLRRNMRAAVRNVERTDDSVIPDEGEPK